MMVCPNYCRGNKTDIGNTEQRIVFLKELELFLNASQLEQEYHLQDEILTLEEYWTLRMGTVCVGPCLALAEFELYS